MTRNDTSIATAEPSAEPSAIPLACVPDAIPAADRPAHFALGRRLFATAVRGRRELTDGVELRLDIAALPQLVRWMDNERRCCPFLTFGIEVGPGDADVRLRLTGPEGTRAFLAAELPFLDSHT